MEKIIEKAGTLVEALPYIKRFRGKVFVIKYGGSILSNNEIRHGFLNDISFLNFVGIEVVLIHGGGPEINERLKKEGLKVEFVNGLRVTDEKTMTIVDEVLTSVNGSLVTELSSFGVEALGLTSKKDKTIHAKPAKGIQKLGFVGEVEEINTAPIRKAFEKDAIAVISPVGVGEGNNLYNINADEAASKIAVSLSADKLVLLTDVQGVLRDKTDEKSIASTLSVKEAEGLIEKGVIKEGMIPKVKSCIDALKGGVNKTHMISGRTSHSLLLEIFTDKGIGTEIVK